MTQRRTFHDPQVTQLRHICNKHGLTDLDFDMVSHIYLFRGYEAALEVLEARAEMRKGQAAEAQSLRLLATASRADAMQQGPPVVGVLILLTILVILCLPLLRFLAGLLLHI